jgi:tetratricopeptide (TPR) repeat protein
MKKILCAILLIAVSYTGFFSISLAQNESPANDAGQQEDVEQNMNDIIKRLDALQNDEGMNKGLLLPKYGTSKTEKKLNPADSTGPSQTRHKFFAQNKGQVNEIEKNVDAMIKALEELNKGGFENSDDHLNPSSDPTQNNTAGKRIEKTNEVVRLDPAGPDSHFQNGLVYWKSKNLDAAIGEFKEVVRLDPENAHAYWNLGLLNDESNRGPEAIANIKKAEGIYSKYNYPLFVEDARKRLKHFREKYGQPLPD